MPISKEDRTLVNRITRTTLDILKKVELRLPEYAEDESEASKEATRGNYTLALTVNRDANDKDKNRVMVRIYKGDEDDSKMWASFCLFDDGPYSVIWCDAPRDHFFHDFSGKYPTETESENVFYDALRSITARFLRIPTKRKK